jgi:hypothetical protein
MIHCPKTMAPYSYRPLDVSRNEIRLLRLLPGEDMPRVEIFHVSLDDDPQYEALSYAWGDPGGTKTVQIVDAGLEVESSATKLTYHEVQATKNLEAALLRLRGVREVRDSSIRIRRRRLPLPRVRRLKGPTRTKTVRRIAAHQRLATNQIFWIDAICINQKDLIERGQQVRLMARIYEKCSRVCIWLGEAANDSNLIMDLAISYTERMRHATVDHTSILEGMISFENNPWTFFGRISALLHFLHRPWFRRLWIMQEILLPPNGIVLCGTKSSDWKSLWQMVLSLYSESFQELKNLIKNGSLEDSELPKEDLDWLITLDSKVGEAFDRGMYPLMLLGIFESCMKDHVRFKLRSLLPLVEHRGFRNSRDAIYALLSLASDVEGWDIDYSSNVLRVFAYATKRIVQQEASLDILCHARICVHEGGQTLSWLPRFDYRPAACGCKLIESNCLAGSQRTMDTTTSPSTYNASRNAEHTFNIDDQNGELKVAGVFVDVVRYVLEKPSYVKGSGISSVVHIPDQWLSLASSLERKGFPFRESFWRTLVANRIQADGERTFVLPPVDWGMAFRAWLKLTGTGFTAPLDPAAVPEELADLTDPLCEFSDRVSSILMEGKVLVVTQSGRLGLARFEAVPEDLVCIMMGCSVPMIIRPVSHAEPGKYILIGESYIHGIMDGEVMDELDAKKYELKEITIV